MKFAIKELKLISDMRGGWELIHTEIAGNIKLSLRKGGEYKKINLWGAFNSLVKMGVIKDVGKHGWATVYVLTELGKTCEINKTNK